MADRTARVPLFGTSGSRSPQPPDRSTMRLLRNSLLQGNYSDQQKQQALKDLPSDLSEYSDCGEILNTPNPSKPGGGGAGAGAGAGGGPGSGGGAGGPTPPKQSTVPAPPS